MADETPRSRAQIEAELASARARLADNLEALVAEVHPKSVAQRRVEDVKFFAKNEVNNVKATLLGKVQDVKTSAADGVDAAKAKAQGTFGSSESETFAGTAKPSKVDQLKAKANEAKFKLQEKLAGDSDPLDGTAKPSVLDDLKAKANEAKFKVQDRIDRAKADKRTTGTHVADADGTGPKTTQDKLAEAKSYALATLNSAKAKADEQLKDETGAYRNDRLAMVGGIAGAVVLAVIGSAAFRRNKNKRFD